jgi:hypothetical protein
MPKRSSPLVAVKNAISNLRSHIAALGIGDTAALVRKAVVGLLGGDDKPAGKAARNRRGPGRRKGSKPKGGGKGPVVSDKPGPGKKPCPSCGTYVGVRSSVCPACEKPIPAKSKGGAAKTGGRRKAKRKSGRKAARGKRGQKIVTPGFGKSGAEERAVGIE